MEAFQEQGDVSKSLDRVEERIQAKGKKKPEVGEGRDYLGFTWTVWCLEHHCYLPSPHCTPKWSKLR